MQARTGRYRVLIALVALAAGACSGCYYLGMHGPSIQQFPQVHQGVAEDAECLSCHHPDHASGPATSHPGFTGCLKCHNDLAR